MTVQEKEGRNLMVGKKQTDGKQTHALSEVSERFDRSQSYRSSARLLLPSLITERIHKQLVAWQMEKVEARTGLLWRIRFIMLLTGDSSFCLLVTKQHQCPESFHSRWRKWNEASLEIFRRVELSRPYFYTGRPIKDLLWLRGTKTDRKEETGEDVRKVEEMKAKKGKDITEVWIRGWLGRREKENKGKKQIKLQSSTKTSMKNALKLLIFPKFCSGQPHSKKFLG